MKAIYIIAILVVALLLIGGCKKAPEPVPVVPEPEPEPVVEPEPEEEEIVIPTDTKIAEQVEEQSFEGVDEKVQRLVDVCKAGNVGVCTTLKTKYNMDVSPE